MQIIFLSCLKATELIEKGIHFKLNMIEKLQLKVHKMMCSACATYEKQSDLIEKGISNSQKDKQAIDDIAELKKMIKKRLEGLKN